MIPLVQHNSRTQRSTSNTQPSKDRCVAFKVLISNFSHPQMPPKYGDSSYATMARYVTPPPQTSCALFFENTLQSVHGNATTPKSHITANLQISTAHLLRHTSIRQPSATQSADSNVPTLSARPNGHGPDSRLSHEAERSLQWDRPSRWNVCTSLVAFSLSGIRRLGRRLGGYRSRVWAMES
jgi:hypothetical protein